MKPLFLLLLMSNIVFLQNIIMAAAFDEIPQSHHNHPELGVMPDSLHAKNALYELVHLRTMHSKTILNNNKTKTTIHSSLPLHYKDQRGYWLTLRNELTHHGRKIIFPSHNPHFIFEKDHGTLALITPSLKQLSYQANSHLVFVDEFKSVNKYLNNKNSEAIVANDNVLKYPSGFKGVDFEQHYFNGALVNTYLFQNQDTFEDNFDYLLINENIELPENYTLVNELIDDQLNNRLLVLNEQQQVVFTIQQPFISDNKKNTLKTRYLHQPYQAGLSFIQTGLSSYVIQIEIDGKWIKDPQREFPIVAKSVVTIENNDVVNSCFFPIYQQATMQVDIPEGETVLWTDIEYDFVAIGEGWISDQRSFISGPAGQTSVFSGSDNNPGTQTYLISNSEIGNGVSPGEIHYVFNFSRDWGGSGCNASFNFVNRRLLSITYGSLVFGDGPIMINEYSASNRNFLDGFGRTEDWIEIYNADPDFFFNMEGYYLSNDAQNPGKWQITNGIIPPGGHLVVFCSERDISSGMVQHANFNLTQLRPDQIVLTDPDGDILESLSMHITQVNHSYGRVHDGAEDWGVFIAPTPGQPNNDAYITYASKPSFSMAPGNYQGSVTIAMETTGSNEHIRYTTNGSTPTITSSIYNEPLVLNQTTVLRARTFSTDENILPGFIQTKTYFINEQHTLPVFSFSGDQDMFDLFNGNSTLRPLGHFEYFEADGQFVDGNFGDFNKHGNDSWNYDQRGVDFISRDDYGYKRRLEHKFFKTSDRTRFRRLMVKAAANDNYPFETGGAHIRDSYIQTLSQVAGLDLDERSSTNILVYLNGQYWGVYDLRERVDDNNFTNYYYGQDYTFSESDIYLQFLKTWAGTSAHFGNQPAITDWQNLRQYIQSNNMGVPEHYQYVKSRLNIESLIDYFVINSFVVSRDWLNYNTGWWRGLNPDGLAKEWRYILWDMEAALGHFNDYTGLPNATATAPPCQAENLNVGDGHTNIIRKLIQQNPEVHQKYVTRYIDLLNTHFSTQEAIALLDSMVDVIAPEMPRHIERWGGDIATWQNNVQEVREFLSQRYNYLINNGLVSCYNLTGPFNTTFNVVPESSGKIMMNSVWLPSYPFNAQVFGNIQTNLQALGKPEYTFSHWEVDGAVVESSIYEPNIILMINQAASVTAHFNSPYPEGELIYYWHFNDLMTPEDVTTIPADYQLIPDALPMMTYTGSGPRDIDANDNGSELNLQLGQHPGKSARVRNPAEGRSLIFDLPTTGYKDIHFTYAVERTNNGMLKNIVSYSIDGSNFIQEGLNNIEFNLETSYVYYLVNLDFSLIDGATNNPNFKVKVDFEENTSGTNGNNRFDNITLRGISLTSAISDVYVKEMLKIYPNPAKQSFNIDAADIVKRIQVYNVFGQLIDEYAIEGQTLQINSKHYGSGVYIVRALDSQGLPIDSRKLVIR